MDNYATNLDVSGEFRCALRKNFSFYCAIRNLQS